MVKNFQNVSFVKSSVSVVKVVNFFAGNCDILTIARKKRAIARNEAEEVSA